MCENTMKKDHFNLYYIFAEDKEQNQLDSNKATTLWENIVKSVQK